MVLTTSNPECEMQRKKMGSYTKRSGICIEFGRGVYKHEFGISR